jgi:uncharacterized protein YndB with AHSA1/START domain
MLTATTDRIEKTILLRAPVSRVWRAVATAEEFGRWFGVQLSGAFAPGARLTGKVTHPGYEHYPFTMTIERIEPERLFSWRWHPNAVDPTADYSAEPTTLIVFTLEPVREGTQLTIVESGFAALPPERREEAYRGNERGWTGQVKAIEAHLAKGA